MRYATSLITFRIEIDLIIYLGIFFFPKLSSIFYIPLTLDQQASPTLLCLLM